MKALVRTNIREPVVALDDISLTVDPGEILAVVGPNGAGKTTMFRILVGLTTPTSGSVAVMGYDATYESVAVRSLVGWMPGDERSLLMRLTCKENLVFHGRMQGLKGKRLARKIEEALDSVDLGDMADKTIFALSAGMRARLQLARALVHEPDVLILDEPTGAVDPVAAHKLLNLITTIVRERKLGAMISSHRLEEIEALQSRVVLLDKGRIRYDGDLDTLRDRLDRPSLDIHFARPESAERAAKVLEASGLPIAVSTDGTRTHLILDHATPAGMILTRLGDMLEEVERVHEYKRPLRDLLSEIYDTGEEHPTDRDNKPSTTKSGRKRREKRQKNGRRYGR